MVDLLDSILRKQELRGVNRDFAAKLVADWFLQYPKVKKRFLEKPEGFLRSKDYKQLQTAVREKLRRVYGVFFLPEYVKKRDLAVQAVLQEITEERVQAVLSLHRSTYERLAYYPFILNQLLGIVGNVSSVLDLGCGFNPFGAFYLQKNVAYHCADIACADLENISLYLEKLALTHTTHCIDLTQVDEVKKLPQADVAFAFKIFDSLEEVQPRITKKLLAAIPAKTIITSFPTASIGQKKHIRPREWFAKLVTGKVLETVTLPNEQFLIITK